MTLLDFDQETFRARYNRLPFLFRHRLSDHPLLQFPRLFELARHLPREEVLKWNGRIPVTADFDHADREHASECSLEDALLHIEETGSYVLIRHAQLDPEYKRLLDQILDEVLTLSEPLDPGMSERSLDVFIAAPGSVTPYHMDREMNFLVQVHGFKTVHLWDPADRSVLSEAELETLFARRSARRPQYKEEYGPKAIVFEIGPGQGVHQPFTAPHWVRSGDQVSVALAATFHSRASDRRAAVHKMNYSLRRVGLRPTPFGHSEVRDSVKHHTVSTYRRAKALLAP